MEFLELNTKVPELQVPNPALVGNHKETRSIMDFQYWTSQKLMFLTLGDQSSFLTKSSLFSFGKKKDPVQTPGSLSAYLQGKRDSKDIGQFNFEQQWWMNFPVVSTSLDWSEKLGILVCGEDSGTLHFVKPYESNPMKYDELFFLKVHSERINKVVIDEDKKVIYTISDDRKFKETSFDKKKINNEFEVSSKKPNCMFVDKETKVAYVGDSEGNVKIIDLAKNPPTVINNIKVNSKDSIVGIDVSNNLIFSGCADSGKVFVHHLPEPKNSVRSNNSVEPGHTEIHLNRLQGHYMHQVLERKR